MPANPLAKLGKDTLSYGLAAVLQKALAFLLFPIYARLLSQPEFGAQDLIASTLLVAAMFLTLGMDSATLIHFYEAEESEREALIGTWVTTQVVLASALATAALLMLFLAPGMLPKGPADTLAYLLAVLCIPLDQTTRALQFVTRLRFRPWAYSAIQVAGLVAQVSAGVLLIVVWKLRLHGVFGALLLGSLVQALVAVWAAGRPVRLRFSRVWLGRLLRTGLPLVPGVVATWAIAQLNRFVLAGQQGLADVALLGVAARISSILLFALSALEVAWGPFAMSVAGNRSEARRIYGRVLTLVVAGGALGFAALSLFSREAISLLAGGQYLAAARLVPVQLAGYLAWVCAYIVGIGTSIEKKTYHTSIAVTLSAVVSLVGGLLFVPRAGAWGAALGTSLGQIAYLGYMYAAGQRCLKVEYEKWPVLALLATSLLAAGGGLWLDDSWSGSLPALALVKGAILLGLVASWQALKVGLKPRLQELLGRA